MFAWSFVGFGGGGGLSITAYARTDFRYEQSMADALLVGDGLGPVGGVGGGGGLSAARQR